MTINNGSVLLISKILYRFVCPIYPLNKYVTALTEQGWIKEGSAKFAKILFGQKSAL